MEKAIFYPFLMFVFTISMIGGWIPTIKMWSQETFRLVISFCAGILLGAVFFHVLPEISPVLGSQLGYSIMFGFLLIFVLEKFIMVHPCEEGECNYHKVGLSAYVGIGLHSILDGIAIGAGTMMNLSVVIILAVTIHKFPAALALSSLLVKGGEYSKKKILWSMFIFSLATPVGALFAVFIFQGLDDYTVATALGISAGTFLFISIGDLLPTVYEEHEKGYKNLVSLCMGTLVMILSHGLA
ncbi:MAG TPA: transporter, Zip family protein [Nitrospina sp.]|jgi:zinc and cadmium transporter|nr:transporter, Zip family protein [Nitrospinota bacterium]MBV51510.1 transporter, Zip family protein [Nitrospinota bacterium]MDP6335333.1 ZIP family metal transporter [Nitrospinaceae bacterium]MDP7147640.1 ZIP family metal transporter [Nitrospinaceae bacterium]HAX46687.1 transporter, Zip family protein [Nitrospina sp.]|tara:strand:+ start:3265 stop:3987 length:723 start_codon:yes stop_codon:yes gene_type:complete